MKITHHLGSASLILNMEGGLSLYNSLLSRSAATSDVISSPLYWQTICPLRRVREANAHLPAARSSQET